MSRAASVVIRSISKSFGARTVLADVSFTLGPHTRMGIVGPNGVGKSTLLRLIAGLDSPDDGIIERQPPTTTIGYLPQEPERQPGETLHQFLQRRTGVLAADAELADAADALGAGAPGADNRYADALERYLALGAADFDARIGVVCADVGLPEQLLTVAMTALSGGQAARASLAAILLSRFDIFLLDEPTNDIDFAGLDRLERFLSEIDAGVLVVSHDRAFLETCVTSVLEIDQASHRGAEYRMSWKDYLEAKAVTRRHGEEAYAVNQTQRSGLTDRVQRQQQWAQVGVRRQKQAPADNDKYIRRFRMEGSEKQAAKAAASERALQRLETVEKPWEGWELRMELPVAPRSGDIVARLDQAVMQRGEFTLGPLDVEVNYGERIAITGANGVGKSTLLAALLGKLPLTSGEQWMGPGVVIGELDQARRVFGTERLLQDTFMQETGLLAQQSRSLLAKFGLGAEQVGQPCIALSPGERTRAILAALMATETNCLVLDEPTNHLDLAAIEQLEAALDTFTGTVLVVTHDRRLLESLRLTRSIPL